MGGGAGEEWRPVGSAAAVIGTGLRRFATAFLDAILPPRCLACGDPVDRQGGICPACWQHLSFIGPPVCLCCGVPFDVSALADTLCSACLTQHPPFFQARAAVRYDDASRPLVFGLKHGDQTYAATAYGTWLARFGGDILVDATLLAPVPLHRLRLFRRRYNQAALLAQAIHRCTGIAHVPDLLIRQRSTPTQGGLNRARRQRNVGGAFRVRAGRATQVEGAHVVLIDDVLTTGATVSECATVLLRAGAARVSVLTLARVVLAQ